MDRRTLLGGLVGGLAVSGGAHAQADAFQALLAQLDADPSQVEDAWTVREVNRTRGVGQGEPSTRIISERARDMIIRLEVSSPQRYERLYQRPIWPKGASGVTIGVGYDLRFANRAFLERDWGSLISAEMIETLVPVLGLGGTEARDAIPSVQSVVVPWAAAQQQFMAFIPYPTKQTEDLYPNSGELSDDSFGALVSLVYNRGSAIPQNSQRRREMREIRDLMRAREFAGVPTKIRDMKRLWPQPEARGLILRRELEAQLFELGMA